MALEDLTAEQQVFLALLTAREALTEGELTQELRERALAEIREAMKRIEEIYGSG